MPIRKIHSLICALACLAAVCLLGSPQAMAQDTHAQPEAHAASAGHAATDAHGADTAGVIPTVQQGIVPMLVTLAVFGLVLTILSVKVWPMITKGLKDREDKIRNEIEAAEMAQQQAREALQQYEKSLAQARAEANRMLEEAKSQQQAIAADLRAKSEIELNAMRDRAKKDIESAKRAAVSELYAEASNLATSIAGKILQREIRSEDQQRLVQESLKELQGVGRN